MMETVNIVLPDATRPLDPGVVSRLLERHASDSSIRIVIATGAHRVPDVERERRRLEIPREVPLFVHDCDAAHERLGEWEYDPAILSAQRNILVGPITFHYLAGFGGGRKLIAPGCLSRKSITALHRLSYDQDCSGPASGTGMGCLEGNPFHAALVEAAKRIGGEIETVNLLPSGEEIRGDLVSAHREACRRYLEENCIEIAEPAERALVRQPHDTDLYQAHKALVAAAQATREGGEITLMARCPAGFGPKGFAEALEWPTIEEHASRLRKNFQVPVATALSLRRLAQRFRIRILSDLLPGERLGRIGITVLPETEDRNVRGETYDLVLPRGAATLPVVKRCHSCSLSISRSESDKR
ncbi:MAG: DUF2088 domain-containing protein [Candidatus Hydrogenedentota bacterium]|nr:MAG: DUF2088 domain-containing protein [Candidatus Hydrogenedentota bacterium]